MLHTVKNHGPLPLMVENEFGELTRLDAGGKAIVFAPKRIKIIGHGRSSYSCTPVHP
mgnify:CR=1 FL=1